MISFLFIGFFIGMSHALEADHLVAVGTLASKGKASPRRLAILGASWGIGHTLTLLLISLPVILFGFMLSARLEAGLEFAVGIMLIALGANVLWKMQANKVHFHIHDHGDNKSHIHAHGHQQTKINHDQDLHDHCHPSQFSLRAFFIGLSHGAAGSAGLLALAAAATQNTLTALAYLVVFGIGSILGMAILTYGVSWPLRVAEKSASQLFKYVQVAVAGAAIFIGLSVLTHSAPIILAGS